MRPRQINNAVHRDLGYLLAGTAILYAVSGLALNHADHWNPNFIIERREITLALPEHVERSSRAWADAVLASAGESARYRGHDFPTSKRAKIYLDDGSLSIDLATGSGVRESARRRPVFYHVNWLHVRPERAWRVFSDLFAVALIVVSATGLFVLKGRKGIAGRGAVLTAAGVLIPLVFALML